MADYLDRTGLLKYDELIKQYIDGKLDKFYKFSFKKEDWVQIEYTSKYKIEIYYNTHGMKTPYVSDYYIVVDGDYKKAIPATAKSFKTIIIKTETPADGFVIIKDKEN